MRKFFSLVRRICFQVRECVFFALWFACIAASLSTAAKDNTDNHGDNLACMNEVVALLRGKNHLVCFEPTWPTSHTSAGSLLVDNTNNLTNILQSACREFTEYKWRKNGDRYRVFPAKAALCEMTIPSMTISNRSLLATLQDPDLKKILERHGLLLSIPRNMSQQWRDIHLSLEFQGGFLADFLDTISENLGNDICWSIEVTKAEPVRVLVGNKVVTRPFFTLHFHSLDGKQILSTTKILKAADMDKLRDIVAGKTPGSASEAAFELALRYWSKGEITEATNNVQNAEKLALSEMHRWKFRYRALIEGLGYPSADHNSKSMLVQHKAFVSECPYAPIRQQALWWMLKEYARLAQEERARNLIESASEDQEWQIHASRYYQKQFPNARQLDQPPQTRNTTHHKSPIRTTVTIKRTPDGKLQVDRQTGM